jgi:hypothetical protein
VRSTVPLLAQSFNSGRARYLVACTHVKARSSRKEGPGWSQGLHIAQPIRLFAGFAIAEDFGSNLHARVGTHVSLAVIHIISRIEGRRSAYSLAITIRIPRASICLIHPVVPYLGHNCGRRREHGGGNQS